MTKRELDQPSVESRASKNQSSIEASHEKTDSRLLKKGTRAGRVNTTSSCRAEQQRTKSEAYADRCESKRNSRGDLWK
jgi:hypothetical protein